MADPGFFWRGGGGEKAGVWGVLIYFFAGNCMKMKEFRPPRWRIPGAPPPHSSITLHGIGNGTGNDGFIFYAMYCRQGQGQGTGTGTNGFHTHFLFPIPVPGPVQCEWAIGSANVRCVPQGLSVSSQMYLKYLTQPFFKNVNMTIVFFIMISGNDNTMATIINNFPIHYRYPYDPSPVK